MQVLVVDDDRAIRETLRLALEEEGYSVIEAPDGAAALDILHATLQPMVVLLDLRMPRVSGDEVLRRVARNPQLTARNAFALVTANLHTLAPASDDLLDRMHVPVIAKPFELDELLDVVERMAYRLSSFGPDLPSSACMPS